MSHWYFHTIDQWLPLRVYYIKYFIKQYHRNILLKATVWYQYHVCSSRCDFACASSLSTFIDYSLGDAHVYFTRHAQERSGNEIHIKPYYGYCYSCAKIPGISSNNANKIAIVSDQFHTKILHLLQKKSYKTKSYLKNIYPFVEVFSR